MPSQPRPQVLMLTHRVPYPPDRGDRIRSWNILCHLSLRADVSLACVCDEPQHPKTRGALESVCRRVVIAPVGPKTRWLRAGTSALRGKSMTEGLFWSPRLARTLDHWADAVLFDAALVYCSSMLSYTQRRRLSRIPKVVDLVDADSQKWQDYAANAARWKRPLYRLEASRIRRLERQSIETSRAVTLVSDAEASVLRTSLGVSHGNIHGLSNGVDTDFFDPEEDFSTASSDLRFSIPADEPAGALKLVFIGALNYHPNVDGLRWFAAEIWPHLRQRFPGVELDVVGRNPNSEVKLLDRIDGIRLVGPVADVRPYVARAHAVIAPLRIARGIQNKILEAMAMAKPVIATAEAAEGIDAIPDKELILAQSLEDWIEAVEQLQTHPELGEQFGTAARKLVIDQYNWAERLKSLDALLGIR